MLRNHRHRVWSIMGGFRSYQCIYYLGQSLSLRVTWFAQHSAQSKTLTCSQDMPQHDAYFMNVCKVLKKKKKLRKEMLWQYRCGSLCEMQFISVVCGLAVIQKQPILVDRAFNRASPSHFPEPAFQALLQTSASIPVSHFWLLPLTPTHSSALSLFPYPAFLT